MVVHGRPSRDEVEAVAAEIRALGRQALVVLGDVADEPTVVDSFARIDARFGGVDILVNNAAIRGQRPFLDMTLQDWQSTMAVILDGTFLCSREGLRRMVARGGGTVVNLGGVSAHVGAKQRAQVAVAGAGLLGLTKSLAVEFADRNITVNCVAPGKIGGPRSVTAGVSPAMGHGGPIVGREGHIEEAAFVIRRCAGPRRAS